MGDSNILGVYLKIPESISQIFRRNTELLVKNNNKLSLEIPHDLLKYHVTLFMSPFPISKQKDVIKAVEGIARDLKQIILSGEKLSTSKNKLFLFLDVTSA